MILLLPIDSAVWKAKMICDRRCDDSSIPPVRGAHLDPGDGAVDAGKLLRRVQADVHIGVVVFVHPGLENAGHFVLIDSRYVATGCRVLLNTSNGDEIDLVTRPDVKARR